MIFHVVGNVQEGMIFEHKPAEKPETSLSFVSKSALGWVAASDMDLLEATCRANPPPEKQFNGPRRINPTKPLRRCQEWTAETIQTLRESGIVRNDVRAVSHERSNSGERPRHRSFPGRPARLGPSPPAVTPLRTVTRPTVPSTRIGITYVHSDGTTSWAGQQSRS
ncbi:hypothetical protein QBC43DRAFT_309847 [Cladorrhinum sp. PSN259]|nr:hypothetical protein QBC43DRAFT_309847 [Cladorrhinum sp. PSN259]